MGMGGSGRGAAVIAWAGGDHRQGRMGVRIRSEIGEFEDTLEVQPEGFADECVGERETDRWSNKTEGEKEGKRKRSNVT